MKLPAQVKHHFKSRVETPGLKSTKLKFILSHVFWPKRSIRDKQSKQVISIENRDHKLRSNNNMRYNVHLKNLQVELWRYLTYTGPRKRSQILLNNQNCSENILWLHAICVTLHCLNTHLLFLGEKNINLVHKESFKTCSPKHIAQ